MTKAGQEYSTNPGASGILRQESGLAGRICGCRTAVPWRSSLFNSGFIWRPSRSPHWASLLQLTEGIRGEFLGCVTEFFFLPLWITWRTNVYLRALPSRENDLLSRLLNVPCTLNVWNSHQIWLNLIQDSKVLFLHISHHCLLSSVLQVRNLGVVCFDSLDYLLHWLIFNVPKYQNFAWIYEVILFGT